MYYRPWPNVKFCYSAPKPLDFLPNPCHTNSMNKGNEMKVYSVMGGWYSEGFDGDSLQLFDCKSAANAYSKELQLGLYDYAYVKEMEVQMHSAIAA